MTRLWCVLIIALIASQNPNAAPAALEATDKAPAEPNDPSATAGRTAAEDPNDPNDPSASAGRTAAEDPNDPNDPSASAGRTAAEDPNDPNNLSATAGRTAAEDPNDPNNLSATAGRTAAKDPNDPNEILWKKWDVVIKDPNDPNEMLWKKWCAVTKVLQTKTIAQETKERIIDKIVTPIFDFQGMAQLVLGSKKHWPQLTKPQREKFTTLFTKRLKTSYREKISLYTDETASLKPAQRTNTTVHIPMELVSKDKKMLILYKLRKVDKSWKIYDVEIEGVGILLTYRSQFDDILQNGTVENFLKGLEEPPTP
ncbi:MAG: ABC transporter substrate-binding protein [Sedimentisphaerales bacterium]|nr:ABC transporter substrate-binding protein [Sedimentisphaerales bacterium]